MNENESRQLVYDALKTVFEKHTDSGIESMYLHGSITSDEFNSETSDVDPVAIVSPDHSVDREAILAELKELAPEIKEFGFRFVSTQELKEGRSIDNVLTYNIPARALLHDLNHWTYVAGKEYSAADFTDDMPEPSELIAMRLFILERDGWFSIANLVDKNVPYYIKKVYRIIHLRQLERGEGEQHFTKRGVESAVNETEGEILGALKDVKAAGSTQTALVKHASLLDAFLAEMVEKYGTKSV